VLFEPWIPKRAMKPYVFIVDANASMLEIVDEKGGSKRYVTVRGGSNRLAKLANNTTIYSLVKPKQLILFGGAQNWKVITYHNRPQRMIYYDAVPVYAFSTFGPDPQELLPFFDALRDLGVGPSSLSTMANNSWKRTLKRRWNFVEWGKGPKIGRAAFHGGRKEALQPVPATYSGVKCLDLPGAYLQAMSDPIPVQLSQRGKPQWEDEGICEAIVRIPHQPWNPLPFRLGRGQRGIDLQVYASGAARGFFVISELRNAVENHGVDAELIRVWKGYPIREPFKEWLPWAFELRQLPGASGLAAKHLTTRLWSLFARNPAKYSKVIVSFEDSQGRRKLHTEIPGASNNSLDGAVFIAAIIASRVRVRLLEELIPAGAVQVDTDGGIVPDTAHVPGWAEKRNMSEVEIISSQAYRWRCKDCPNHCSNRHPKDDRHYSVAGFPPDYENLPAIFEHTKPNQLLRVRSYAAVSIPAQPFEDAQRWIESADIEAVPDDSL
jgi:hypothetical protein